MKKFGCVFAAAILCQICLQAVEPRGGHPDAERDRRRPLPQQSVERRGQPTQAHPNAPEGEAAAAGYARGENQSNNQGNQNPVYIMPQPDTQGTPGQPINPQ